MVLGEKGLEGLYLRRICALLGLARHGGLIWGSVVRRILLVPRPGSSAGRPVPRPVFGTPGVAWRRFRTWSGPVSRGSGSLGRGPVPWPYAFFPGQRAGRAPCALGFGFSTGSNRSTSAGWLRPRPGLARDGVSAVGLWERPPFEVCGRWVSVAAFGLGASGSWRGACGCSLGA